jgi:hypothetical protein
MINSVQFTLLAFGSVIIILGAISYRKWRRSNVDRVPKKSEETSLDLYGWAKDPAKQIKTALQMLLGIGLVVLILTKLFCVHKSCQLIPVVGDIMVCLRFRFEQLLGMR